MITARFGSSSVTVGIGHRASGDHRGDHRRGEPQRRGRVSPGRLLGALFMGMLANSLNLLGVDVYWQNLVTGMMLILAVVFDMINESRKEQRK